MANYCDCDLVVKGDAQAVQEFLVRVQSDNDAFDFNQILPYPAHFQELDDRAEEWRKRNEGLSILEQTEPRPKDGYNNGGWEWCMGNWGTAGGIESKIVRAWGDAEVHAVEINFLSPCSPPESLIQYASSKFPKLQFVLVYYEGGCGFHGVLKCEGGKVLCDETAKYFGTRGG
jgi:hypothetical protein